MKTKLEELLEYFNEALERPESRQTATVNVDRVKLCDLLVEVGTQRAIRPVPKRRDDSPGGLPL
jgi:hypothetical protein